MSGFPKPTLGFAAYSGTGKTTLLTQLIPLLRERGIRLAVVKHAHHEFDIDKPGKDSYELRKAGAVQTLIASKRRWALVTESTPESEPTLADLVARLDHAALDLILVEGFKHVAFPKIELHRARLGKPFLFPDDRSVIAIACDDTDLPDAGSLPLLDLNDPSQIAEFIHHHVLRGREIGN